MPKLLTAEAESIEFILKFGND